MLNEVYCSIDQLEQEITAIMNKKREMRNQETIEMLSKSTLDHYYSGRKPSKRAPPSEKFNLTITSSCQPD